MQHATLRNISVKLPLTTQNLEADGERALQINRNDKTIPIIQQQQQQPQTNDQLPSSPSEIAQSHSEPKYSSNYSKLVTKTTTSVRMPHPAAVNGGDAIDCANAAQKENRHHELTLAPAAMAYENKPQSTPTTPVNISYHKDGHYFLTLLKSEQTRLLTMAEQAERDMYALTTSDNTEISDEIFGILRAVSGKTKLLVSQKFKQFEGLCHSNLNPTTDEKFPTTMQDLQGFWDMVYLQIEHVDSLFKELDLIKANNWQTTKDIAAPFVPAGSKLLKRPVLRNGDNNGVNSVKTSPNAQLIAQKREAQRKQLLELKRKNKNAATDNAGPIASPIEIFVSEHFV